MYFDVDKAILIKLWFIGFALGHRYILLYKELDKELVDWAASMDTIDLIIH